MEKVKGYRPYLEREHLKREILEELEKQDWRPSFIRSVLRGWKDKGVKSAPTEEEYKLGMFLAARIYKTSINSMLSKNRVRRNVSARQLFFHYFYGNNYHEKELAELFGLQRCVVYHSYKKVQGLLDINYKPAVKEVEKFKTLMEL